MEGAILEGAILEGERVGAGAAAGGTSAAVGSVGQDIGYPDLFNFREQDRIISFDKLSSLYRDKDRRIIFGDYEISANSNQYDSTIKFLDSDYSIQGNSKQKDDFLRKLLKVKIEVQDQLSPPVLRSLEGNLDNSDYNNNRIALLLYELMNRNLYTIASKVLDLINAEAIILSGSDLRKIQHRTLIHASDSLSSQIKNDKEAFSKSFEEYFKKISSMAADYSVKQELKSSILSSMAPRRYQAILGMMKRHRLEGNFGDLDSYVDDPEKFKDLFFDDSYATNSEAGEESRQRKELIKFNLEAIKFLSEGDRWDKLYEKIVKIALDSDLKRFREKFQLYPSERYNLLSAKLSTLYSDAPDSEKETAFEELKKILIKERLKKKGKKGLTDDIDAILTQPFNLDALKTNPAISDLDPIDRADAKLTAIFTKFAAFGKMENLNQLKARIKGKILGKFQEMFATEIHLLDGLNDVSMKGNELLFRGLDSNIREEDVMRHLDSIHLGISSPGGVLQGYGSYQILQQRAKHAFDDSNRASYATATTFSPTVAVSYALPSGDDGSHGWIYEIRPKKGKKGVVISDSTPYQEVDFEKIDPEEIYAVHKVVMGAHETEGMKKVVVEKTILNPHYKKRKKDGGELDLVTSFSSDQEITYKPKPPRYGAPAKILFPEPLASFVQRQSEIYGQDYQRHKHLVGEKASTYNKEVLAERLSRTPELSDEVWDWYRLSSLSGVNNFKIYISIEHDDLEKAREILVSKGYMTDSKWGGSIAKIAIENNECSRSAIILYAGGVRSENSVKMWSDRINAIESDFFNAGIKPKLLTPPEMAAGGSIAVDKKIPGSLYSYFKKDHAPDREQWWSEGLNYFHGVRVEKVKEIIQDIITSFEGELKHYEESTVPAPEGRPARIAEINKRLELNGFYLEVAKIDDPLDAVEIQNNEFQRDGKGIRDRWEDAKAIARSFDYRYKPGHASLLEAVAGAGHDLAALSPPPPAIVSVAAPSLVTAAQTPQLPLIMHGAGVGQSAATTSSQVMYQSGSIEVFAGDILDKGCQAIVNAGNSIVQNGRYGVSGLSKILHDAVDGVDDSLWKLKQAGNGYYWKKDSQLVTLLLRDPKLMEYTEEVSMHVSKCNSKGAEILTGEQEERGGKKIYLDDQRKETFTVTSEPKYKSEQLLIKVRRIKPEKVLFAPIASVDCQLRDKGCAVIIHAVGPDCRSGEFKLIETESRLEQQGKITARKERLKNVYQNIFDEARSKGVKTIALPVLSVGVFEFPKDEAAEVVAEVLHKNKHNFDKISLCYFEKGVAQPDILKEIISKLCDLESLAVTVSSVVGHGTVLGPATLPVLSAPSFASAGVFASAARSAPLSTAFLGSKAVASQAQVLSRSAVPAPALPRPISLASVSNPALPRQAGQSFITLQDQVSKSAIPAGPSRPAVSASVPAPRPVPASVPTYKLPRLAAPSVKPSTHVHSPSATIFPYAVIQESFHRGLVRSQYVGASLSEEDKMREMRNEDAARIIKAARYIDNRLGLNNNLVDNEIKARLIEITYKAAIIAGGIGSRNRRGEIIPCARGRIVTADNGDFIGYQDRDDGSITNSDGKTVTLSTSVSRRIFENGLEYSNGLLSSKIDDSCFSKAAEEKIRQLIANHKMAGIFSSISRVTQEQTEVDNHLFRSAKNIRIAKRFTYFDPETVGVVCGHIKEKGVDARIKFPRRREARGQMFSDNKLSPWGERMANRGELAGRSTIIK